MWDWVDLLGRRFKSLWNPPDSLPWVLSMPQEGSTPDTFGFSSSTEVIALWAKTAKQQHSHLRDFSKSNLKLKADPEFLDHKSEQGVLGQTQIGEALRAIKKKKTQKQTNIQRRNQSGKQRNRKAYLDKNARLCGWWGGGVCWGSWVKPSSSIVKEVDENGGGVWTPQKINVIFGLYFPLCTLHKWKWNFFFFFQFFWCMTLRESLILWFNFVREWPSHWEKKRKKKKEM